MKLQEIIILWAIAFSPFAYYFIANYRRSTRVDRKIDRKAKEAERKRQDERFEMNQRNIQLRKYRKA